MIKNTGIKLDEDDRQDINYAIELINTSYDLMCNPQGAEDVNENDMREYFTGAAMAHVEGRLMLHRLRQEFSKKYNIPYDFISRNGEILLEIKEKDTGDVCD